jgi:transcription-repair coupling factor (superfamily II helicase)
MPESVDNLFEYARLRRIAEEMRVLSVDRTPTGVAFKLSEKAKVNPEKLMDFVSSNENVSFSPNGVLRFPLNDEQSGQILETARQVLQEIRADG